MLDGSTNRRRQMNPFVSKENIFGKSKTQHVIYFWYQYSHLAVVGGPFYFSLSFFLALSIVTYLQSFIRCVRAHCGQKSLTKAIYFQPFVSPLAFRTNQLDQSLFFLASNKLARARNPSGRLIKLTLLLERKLLLNQKMFPVKMKSFFRFKTMGIHQLVGGSLMSCYSKE